MVNLRKPTATKKSSNDNTDMLPAKEGHGTTEFLSPAQWGIEAAAALIDAVRDADGKVPSRFDRPSDDFDPDKMDQWRRALDELISDVSFAFTVRDVHCEWTSPAWRSARLKALSRLRGQLQRAQKQLSDDDRIRDLVDAEILLEDHPGVEESLTAIIAAVEQVEKIIDIGPPLPEGQGRRQDWVMRSLAGSYQRLFNKDIFVDTIRTSDNYHGPFPAFLHAAFEIAGTPKTPVALSAAWDEAFKGASREDRK